MDTWSYEFKYIVRLCVQQQALFLGTQVQVDVWFVFLKIIVQKLAICCTVYIQTM